VSFAAEDTTGPMLNIGPMSYSALPSKIRENFSKLRVSRE
jgi:hypothetical protein